MLGMSPPLPRDWCLVFRLASSCGLEKSGRGRILFGVIVREVVAVVVEYQVVILLLFFSFTPLWGSSPCEMLVFVPLVSQHLVCFFCFKSTLCCVVPGSCFTVLPARLPTRI